MKSQRNLASEKTKVTGRSRNGRRVVRDGMVRADYNCLKLMALEGRNKFTLENVPPALDSNDELVDYCMHIGEGMSQSGALIVKRSSKVLLAASRYHLFRAMFLRAICIQTQIGFTSITVG